MCFFLKLSAIIHIVCIGAVVAYCELKAHNCQKATAGPWNKKEPIYNCQGKESSPAIL